MKKHWRDIFENTLNEADNSKANQLHYAISTAIFKVVAFTSPLPP